MFITYRFNIIGENIGRFLAEITPIIFGISIGSYIIKNKWRNLKCQNKNLNRQSHNIG